MTKASRFSGLLTSKLTEIAIRVRNRMHQLGLTEGDVAKMGNKIAEDLFAEAARPKLSRYRVSKILMNCKGRPEKSAARVISPQELIVLSVVLKASLEWLVGQKDTADPVLWDVIADPGRAEHLLHIMAEYEEKTRSTVIYAESLLCSLTPPDFSHRYHEEHFCELGGLGLERERERLVRVYDSVGEARRARLFGPKAQRNFTLTSLMFLSEVRSIADGHGKYRNIPKRSRRECLEMLHRLVSDSGNGIEFMFVRDEDAPDLKTALRDYERLGCSGSEFTLWSYHWGKVGWSEHSSQINIHGRLLEEFQLRAAYSKPEKVEKLLERLLKALE